MCAFWSDYVQENHATQEYRLTDKNYFMSATSRSPVSDCIQLATASDTALGLQLTAGRHWHRKRNGVRTETACKMKRPAVKLISEETAPGGKGLLRHILSPGI